MNGKIKPVPGKSRLWEVRYEATDPRTGKRRQYKRRMSGTRKDAERYLVEMLNKVNQGEILQQSEILMKDYLDSWMRSYCDVNLAYKTRKSYRSIVDKYLIPYFGRTPISKLRPAQIQEYYTLLAQPITSGGYGLSATSVLYHHRILHETLRHAVNLEYIPYNPCDRVKPPRKAVFNNVVLSGEEAKYIIAQYHDHPIYLPVSLAIMTGMRQGEICGLRWQNVVLESGMLNITHSLQRQNGILVLKEPKTSKSRRSIPIPQCLVSHLIKERNQQKKNRLAQGPDYDGRGFVCAWGDGRPFDPDWVGKQWIRLVKKDPRIPDGVRFHDLRHTHASLLLAQGVNLKVIQERLGHESISTTGDIYSHLTPAMQSEAVKSMDRLFDRANELI
ncbi:MAG: tyrosine-type recombinase/integrase [Deltaproteobacteria bacterium]